MLLVRFDDQTADRAAHLDKAPIVERDATGVQPPINRRSRANFTSIKSSPSCVAAAH
jgi:hypothetical protein